MITKEKKSEYSKTYYEKHKDEVRERQAKYRAEHADKMKTYYLEHKDAIKASQRKYYEKMKALKAEQLDGIDAEKKAEQEAQRKAWQKKYRETHREEYNAKKRQKRAEKRAEKLAEQGIEAPPRAEYKQIEYKPEISDVVRIKIFTNAKSKKMQEYKEFSHRMEENIRTGQNLQLPQEFYDIWK